MINATFVFCDIVGFSRNDDNFQAELVCALNAEVTHQLYDRLSKVEPSVVFLPTGDGLAIVLLENDASPVGRALKTEVLSLIEHLMRFAQVKGNMSLRIGVNQGPVALMRDINGHLNVCGTALNDCQRIMDAAQPNQVLFSTTAYRSLVGDAHHLTTEAYFSQPLSVIVKHRQELQVRIMYREGEPGWETAEPCPAGLIIGKLKRTKLIRDRLSELLRQSDKEITIYEQSALSTFGITDRREPWVNSNSDYVNLVWEQKDYFTQLAEQDRTRMKLVLRPVRKYLPEWMEARCEALLEWLKKFLDNPNVDFVVVEDYEVPNRLIVKGHFCLEGYKMHDTSGYELSILRTAPYEIDEAIDFFEGVFQKQRRTQTKGDVIDYFEKLRLQSRSRRDAESEYEF